MEDFETLLVRHCSPTLAGIKTGSLFNYTLGRNDNLEIYLQKWNHALNPRGVALTILQQDKGRNLVYVYRPNKLANDLACADLKDFLSSIGYDCSDMNSYLRNLIDRIDQCVSFPHEIGLFLGYPLHDVKGFIENGGQNCKCCGLWKVYCSECQALKLFDKFKKCTRIYCRCFQSGSSITRLTVAA
nr:DUF3793 family protein [uncultured Caproiciproducens sp.]